VNLRRLPYTDQLERGDEVLVLLADQAVRVGGLAPAILDICLEWCSIEELVRELELIFGAPPGGGALPLARAAVAELVEAGLVEVQE
jgi:hypothetical protein